ncbi:MAG: hypothetical protein H6713_16920 [Myxococcales bacterium]|nr:hypothetical protein [Myxococcales bacterium]
MQLQVTRAALRPDDADAPPSSLRATRAARSRPTQTDAGARERPVARVECVECGDGTARARIVDYRYPHPELLDASLRAAIPRWRDWIDQWSLERGPAPRAYLDPLIPDELRFRTHNRRELALESDVFRVGAAPVWLRLETIDVLGARWRGGVRVWRDDAGALVTALASS